MFWVKPLLHCKYCLWQPVFILLRVIDWILLLITATPCVLWYDFRCKISSLQSSVQASPQQKPLPSVGGAGLSGPSLIQQIWTPRRLQLLFCRWICCRALPHACKVFLKRDHQGMFQRSSVTVKTPNQRIPWKGKQINTNEGRRIPL